MLEASVASAKASYGILPPQMEMTLGEIDPAVHLQIDRGDTIPK